MADRQDHGTASDELEPSFIRRLIRHGWLAGILGENHPAIQPVIDGIIKAETFTPAIQYQGKPGSVSQMVNGFGRSVWFANTNQRCAYAQTPHLPMYMGSARTGLSRTLLTISLPVGAIPSLPIQTSIILSA